MFINRCIHAIVYYSVIKKNELLVHATTWMDLKIIMLSVLKDRLKNVKFFELFEQT